MFAAKVQSGQLSVQAEIMTHIENTIYIIDVVFHQLLLSSEPWLPVDESHALGNVDCKLNSCCCVHNKSANVTMIIQKVKFV